MPIIEPYFRNCVDFNYNQHDHYFDAVLRKIEPFPDDKNMNLGYKLLNKDLFLPTGMDLTREEGLPIIFDSGCSVAVLPYEEDFGETLTKVSKTMVGLEVAVRVEGEGTLQWEFSDGYGIKYQIYAKAHYIITYTVRLFSPHSDFL